MSDSLWPHGLQHARLPCPSQCPKVCSSSCCLNWWCHPTFLSSVTPFSSCPQSVPASESFPVSWLFTSGDQSTGTSASAIVLPVNIQDWFPFGLTGFSPCSPRGFQESSPVPQFESINFLALAFFMVQFSYPHMVNGKTIALAIQIFVGKVMSLLSNILPRFVIAFLPRSKCLLV